MAELKIKFNVIKEEPAFIITVPREKCKFKEAMAFNEGTEECICCIYGYDHNVYVCPYLGEEMIMESLEDVGPASGYCWFPKIAPKF